MDFKHGIRQDGLGHPALLCLRRRYYIAIMASLGYLFSYSTRVNLSIAILYMTQFKNVTLSNGTVIKTRDYPWNEPTQGFLLSSFFYGYIVTQIPGGYLASQIGGNHVLTIGVVGSGLVSFIGPVTLKLGIESGVAMRVVCGLFQGVTIPAVSSLWARWAPPMERSFISTLAISGNFFSSIIVMPLCSLIGDRLHWEWMFYIFGALSLLWALIWGLTVFAGPEIDKFIKKSELRYIQAAIGERTDKRPIHPWKKLLTSMPVGACVVAQTGHNWGYYTLLLMGPTYFNRTLKYRVREASLMTGFAFTVSGILMQVFGHVADRLRRKQLMSTVALRKTFCCGGFALQAVLMLTLAFARNRKLCTALPMLAIGMGGITWSAFHVNPLDIAAPHSSLIIGISNTWATLPGMLSPLVATAFVSKTKHEISEWMWVWIICAILYVLSAIFFFIFAAGERQSWVYAIPDSITNIPDSITNIPDSITNIPEGPATTAANQNQSNNQPGLQAYKTLRSLFSAPKGS